MDSSIKAEKSFTMISILNQASINTLNSILHASGIKITYLKRRTAGGVKVERDYKSFRFYDKLMRQKPGFTREGDGDEKI